MDRITEYYLGGDISSGEINGRKHIATGTKTYIKGLAEKIERLREWDLRKYNSPEDPNYHPKLDKTYFLDDDHHNIYRMITRSLNWTITLDGYIFQHSVTTLAR